MNVLRLVLGVLLIVLLQFLTSCTLSMKKSPQKRKVSVYEIHKFEGLNLRLDTVYYANSNQIRKIRYLRNDTLLNYEELKYNKDGSLFSYNFYNEHGKIVYMSSYDSQMKLINKKGNPIIQVVVSNQYVNLGETLEVEVLVAKPPRTKYNLYIKTATGNHNVFTLINPCKSVWAKKMQKSGEFLLPIGIDFIYLENNDTIVDGENVNIYVE